MFGRRPEKEDGVLGTSKYPAVSKLVLFGALRSIWWITPVIMRKLSICTKSLYREALDEHYYLINII